MALGGAKRDLRLEYRPLFLGLLAGELFDLRNDADLVLWCVSGAVLLGGAAWAIAARGLLASER